MTQSVYVKVSGPDPKGVKSALQAFNLQQDGTLTTSVTGLAVQLLSAEIRILMPASVLVPYLRPDCRAKLMECTHADLGHFVQIEVGAGKDLCTAKLEGIFPVEEFAEHLRRISTGDAVCAWKMRGSGQEWTPAFQYIAVLQVDMNNEIVSHVSEASHEYEPVRVGDQIIVHGSPLGCLSPEHLTDHQNHGLVSSVPSQDGSASFFLADVSCFPGMEGSPVRKKGHLVGMLMTPISHERFDAEIPVVLSMRALLGAYEAWSIAHKLEPKLLSGSIPSEQADWQNSFAQVDQRKPKRQGSTEPKQNLITAHPVRALKLEPSPISDEFVKMRESVVAVKPKGSWASGVHIGRGLFLTVAHALKGGSELCSQVEIGYLARSGKLTWISAQAIYVFKEGLDLAILYSEDLGHSNISVAVLQGRPAQVGDCVYTVGHGIFSPSLEIGPSILGGNISKIVCGLTRTNGTNRDVILMTTASVFPGASGGAVFSEEGKLLGLTTSNSRYSPTGRSFAKLNYSVSTSLLSCIISVLQDCPNLNKDYDSMVRSLSHLDNSFTKEADLWSLNSLIKGEEGSKDRLDSLLKQSKLFKKIQPELSKL